MMGTSLLDGEEVSEGCGNDGFLEDAVGKERKRKNHEKNSHIDLVSRVSCDFGIGNIHRLRCFLGRQRGFRSFPGGDVHH